MMTAARSTTAGVEERRKISPTSTRELMCGESFSPGAGPPGWERLSSGTRPPR